MLVEVDFGARLTFFDLLDADHYLGAEDVYEKVHQEPTHHQGAEHGGHDANGQSDTEPFDRPRPKADQDACGDEGGDVCIDDG